MASTILIGLRDRLGRSFYQTKGRIHRVFRKHRVVMFHGGRSGSTVLGYMLDEHDQVTWSGEVLSKKRASIYRDKNPSSQFKEILTLEEERSFKKWYGFEMKSMHLRQLDLTKEAFIEAVERLGYSHFILLSRKNILRREISSAVRQVSGYTQLSIGQKPDLIKITLNTSTLLFKLNTYRSDITEIIELLKEKHFLHLNYEDDVEKDPSTGYTKICHFLNLTPQRVAPKIQRVNPFPLRDIVINYDEVIALLRGTEFEWMLE